MNVFKNDFQLCFPRRFRRSPCNGSDIREWPRTPGDFTTSSSLLGKKPLPHWEVCGSHPTRRSRVLFQEISSRYITRSLFPLPRVYEALSVRMTDSFLTIRRRHAIGPLLFFTTPSNKHGPRLFYRNTHSLKKGKGVISNENTHFRDPNKD